MNSISSSFFGQLFGNATHINIDHHGLDLVVKNSVVKIPWQSLISPPHFESGLFGQTITFRTAEQHYQLSKLAYKSKQNYHHLCQQYWVTTHQARLQTLIAKIGDFVELRYLRQSGVQGIQASVKQEYMRWFPWIKSSPSLVDVSQAVVQLSNYQHWKKSHIDAQRERYINKQLSTYKPFFDSVESNPLTAQQRRACIIDNDNNLLLAGAGTGKTSVMVGRTGYLLNSQQANYNDILLLAYGKKAADEMDQRINDKLGTNQISATTFHRLGLNIIAQVEGQQPTVSLFAEDEKAKSKWIQGCFDALIAEHASYRHLVLEYFSKYYYLEKNEHDFATLGDYYQYLTDNDIRSLKGEKVKSFGELYIANWLFSHGIEYQYEASYAVELQTAARKQYQPDFYLPQLNIYIEYYGIDENGHTAPYIDEDEYHASIEWKRQTHQQYNSHCIELTYHLHKTGRLLSRLQEQLQGSLKKQSFEAELLPDEAMLATLKETGRFTLLAEIFAKLVGLYKAACLNEHTQKQVIKEAADSKQIEKAFELLQPILSAYQAKLDANNEIDFEDMIIKAIAYIESGQFRSPWRYIMVDEFQDISEPRARLVKALRDNHRGSSVFAVGDDWQAIYRFSGADVSLTTGFSHYFGATTQTQLDQTFRFNNRISEVASTFVTKNPAQITKTISSIRQVDKAAVSILRKNANSFNKQAEQGIDEVTNGALDEVLTAISAQVNKPTNVYLLARFWFQLPNSALLQGVNKRYPMLNIETQSFHASKGKEADYVVILGLTSGKHGFPSSKASVPILDALLAKQEQFAHAEERRLFYVALTRAKHRVYIIADMTQASDFVKELVNSYDVELNEFSITVNQSFVDQINCLVCETGTLKARTGRYGPFYSCSHFPRCDHKERGCAKCSAVMSRSKYPGFKTCLNPACHTLFPICSECGAEMVLRKSRRGEFWGCRNYRGDERLSCKHGVDKSKIVWPQLSH